MFSHRPSSLVDLVEEQAAALRRSGSGAARDLGDRWPLKRVERVWLDGHRAVAHRPKALLHHSGI
eukprot:2242131-Pyramimonas_sp.AAC.1